MPTPGPPPHRLLIGVLAFTLVPAHGTARADLVAAADGPPVSSRGDVYCGGPVLWEQLPEEVDGTTMASQLDVCYPFEAETADDFVGFDDPVVSVGWWGGDFSGGPLDADGFVIRVRADDGGRPGEVVHETIAGEWEEDGGYPVVACCADLSEPFVGTPGVTYHFSVLIDYCFPPQWGVESGVGNGIEGHQRFPLTGVEEWTPTSETLGVPREVAFTLHAADPVPVETTSFGRIKALFAPSRTD